MIISIMQYFYISTISINLYNYFQRCPVWFLLIVPLLPFKEGLGVVAFDFHLTYAQKKDSKTKPYHPQPLLK